MAASAAPITTAATLSWDIDVITVVACATTDAAGMGAKSFCALKNIVNFADSKVINYAINQEIEPNFLEPPQPELAKGRRKLRQKSINEAFFCCESRPKNLIYTRSISLCIKLKLKFFSL